MRPRRVNALQLAKVGLRRATMENGACRVYHSTYLKKNGYVYCPFCAEELVIKFHCEHCERDFTSEESFAVHNSEVLFYHSNRCPGESDLERHPIRWLKHRSRFYCSVCKREYLPKKTPGEARKRRYVRNKIKSKGFTPERV